MPPLPSALNSNALIAAPPEWIASPSLLTTASFPASPMLRAVIGMWLILLVAVCGKAALSPLDHTTYPCFEAGTRCWWAGVNPYAVETCGFEYRYTPTFAVLFTPFAVLPTLLGGVLWGLVNVFATFAAIELLRTRLCPFRLDDRGSMTLHVLSLLACVRGLWSGQSNMLIFAAAVAGLVAVLNQREWRAAGWLSAPVFIKVWPLALLMLCAACWPKKLIARSVCALLLLAAIPYCFGSPVAVSKLYNDFLIGLAGPMQERHVFRDAWTIWEQFETPVNESAYKWLQLTTAAATLLVCLAARLRFGTSPRTAISVLGAWAAWQLVFGPGVERNTYCMIGPLLAVAALSPDGIWLRTIGVTAYCITTAFSFGVIERKLSGLIPGIETGLPVGVLLFCAWNTLQVLLATAATEHHQNNANDQPALERPPTSRVTSESAAA